VVRVDASALAAKKASLIREELLDSFAGVVNAFSSAPNDEVLPTIPELLVTNFQAARAELWLWEEGSNSLYLTCFAGRPAEHKKNYVLGGQGVLGKIAESRKKLGNEIGRAHV